MTTPRPPLSCAVLLTAAVMFPAGLWVAGELRPDVPRSVPEAATAFPPSRAFRNPYSAKVRNDPYVLEQQRAVVDAMENACRAQRQECREAAQARRYLDARAAEE